MFNHKKDIDRDSIIEDALTRIREEFTVMPRFGFHQPLDYLPVTLPPSFENPVEDDEGLPIPVGDDRFGRHGKISILGEI